VLAEVAAEEALVAALAALVAAAVWLVKADAAEVAELLAEVNALDAEVAALDAEVDAEAADVAAAATCASAKSLRTASEEDVGVARLVILNPPAFKSLPKTADVSVLPVRVCAPPVPTTSPVTPCALVAIS
jgi:hypothetical protein